MSQIRGHESVADQLALGTRHAWVHDFDFDVRPVPPSTRWHQVAKPLGGDMIGRTFSAWSAAPEGPRIDSHGVAVAA